MKLETLSGVELVEIAETRVHRFKDVGKELEHRRPDPSAADELIVRYRVGRMPPWLVAYLLGCARAPRGYDVAREILHAAPGLLAESYAGPAMARIAGLAARDDLVGIMMGDAPQRTRKGAAYGLSVLNAPDTADLMLDAVHAGRVRRRTAAGIVANSPNALSTLLDWFARDDAVTEALALDAASSFLTLTAGEVDARLAWAIRRTLDGGRVNVAPRTRRAISMRIVEALK